MDGISGIKKYQEMKNVKVVTNTKSFLSLAHVKKLLIVQKNAVKKTGNFINHDAPIPEILTRTKNGILQKLQTMA